MSRAGGSATSVLGAQPFLRAIWVTNLAAPYRHTLWSALGDRVQLKVVLLDANISADTRSNRRFDWNRRAYSGKYTTQPLRTLRFRHGEDVYYASLAVPKLAGLDVLLVGGWESPAYWQIAVLARLAGARLIGFYESHSGSSRFGDGIVSIVRRFWFRRLDAVVVPGKSSADTVRAMGVDPSRIFVGFNSVDVAGLAAAAEENRTIGGAHRFVYVGQLIERKNVSVLLRAFADIREDGDQLSIIGSGPEESRLLGLARHLGLHESVRFVGYVPQSGLGEVLGSADTLVLPSLEEVWGLVVNEALASGLHVVVSEAAGVAESVRDMPGVWVTQTDEKSVAEGLVGSRSAYRGPIVKPPILERTPERFADVFVAAFRFAMLNHNSRRARRELATGSRALR